MEKLNNTVLLIGSTIVALFMATLMIFIRSKVAKKPTSVKKIILPPIFMSSGALMFIFPAFRVSLLEISEAVIVGLLFSLLLIKFTKLEVSNDDIYLIPSRSFIFILFGLLLVRIVIKLMIGSQISFGETSGIFFILAFAMIISWRMAMIRKYLQLKRQLMSKNVGTNRHSP